MPQPQKASASTRAAVDGENGVVDWVRQERPSSLYLGASATCPPIEAIVQPKIEQLSERPDLLPAIAGWIYNEWWTKVEGTNLEVLTDLLRTHLIADRIPMTLVASLEGAPVGTATLVMHDAETHEWPDLTPWLAAVYVMPENRRRGVGTSLINALVEKAITLNVEVLYLATVGREQFYSRLGWQVLHRAGDKVVMSRCMARPSSGDPSTESAPDRR